MIAAMRGVDLLVFELIKIRCIRNLMWVYFFETIKTVMEINSVARYFFWSYRFRFSFLCGGWHIESFFLLKFELLFCTCRYAWTPGVERRPQRRPVRVLGGRHEAVAVLCRLALRAALVHRRPGPCNARDALGAGGKQAGIVTSTFITHRHILFFLMGKTT